MTQQSILHLVVNWEVFTIDYRCKTACSTYVAVTSAVFCRRGSLLSTAIFLYAATTPVNGYFGGSLYAKMGGSCQSCCWLICWLFFCVWLLNGEWLIVTSPVLWFLVVVVCQQRCPVKWLETFGKLLFMIWYIMSVVVLLPMKREGKLWIKQMLLSSLLLPVLVCGTAFFINFIAIGYHASRAIPFSSMVRPRLAPLLSVSCILVLTSEIFFLKPESFSTKQYTINSMHFLRVDVII